MLRQYQKQGIKFLKEHKAALLADEMGLGKTVQALLAAQGQTLIVCPNSCKFVWQSEIKKWLNEDDVFVYKNKIPGEVITNKFFIIHYEAMRLLRNSFFLIATDWDTIIFDEAHRLKNRKSKTFNVAKQLKAKNKFLLTGTPVLNRPDELWALLHLINSSRFSSYWKFFYNHCTYEVVPYVGVARATGVRNVKKLKAELTDVMIRREKKDVLDELPAKVYENLYIELSPKQRKLYDEMKNSMLIELDAEKSISAINALALLTRLKQIAISPSLISDEFKNVEAAKLTALKDFLSYNNDKVVIFSQWVKVLNLVEDILKLLKLDYVKITSEVKQNERSQAIQRFQTDENCKVFLGTIMAAGQGLTLTAANKVIFLDKAFTPAYNEQAEDRLHRIGQKSSVTVINFIAKDTVEERIEKILAGKKMMTKELLSNTSFLKSLF